MNVDGNASPSEEKRLGQVVQLARRQAGLTQQSLCQKSGLSYSTLAKIERGAIKSPSIFTIQQIAETLGISLDQLMNGVPGTSQPVQSSQKKTSRSGVKFVYFDMNGCLIRTATTKAFTKLAEESGVSPDVIETIYWQFNEEICRGSKSVDELNIALAQRLQMMVDWNRYYLEAAEATPGIAELVSWIAENYQVGILTNTLPGLVVPMLERGVLPQVHYDAIIDSSEVHALKPEQQMYEIAAERAGVAPNEILLVDDEHANIIAAGRLGWHTMSFDAYSPEESIVAISTALQPAD